MSDATDVPKEPQDLAYNLNMVFQHLRLGVFQETGIDIFSAVNASLSPDEPTGSKVAGEP